MAVGFHIQRRGYLKDLSMAVVIRNGHVLLQERYRHGRGMVFEFPGGAVEANETGVEAAIRELSEETGLRDLEIVGHHTLGNEYGGDIHYVVMPAPIDTAPRIVDPLRMQTFHWLRPLDIPRNDFYSADLQFIEADLRRYL